MIITHSRLVRLLSCALGLMLPLSSYAISSDEALSKVKQSICKDQQTIEQILERTIKSTYQRDIGWRYFQQDAFIDVERAVLINKGIEMRYRWRVEADGTFKPQSDRAERLCL